jgi:hypothetical protein
MKKRECVDVVVEIDAIKKPVVATAMLIHQNPREVVDI